MKTIRLAAVVLGAVLAASPAFAQKQQINGAGATFPYPIYSKWFSEYNKLHPDVEINYQSIGSGGGIRQLSNQTVFFGATDGPMTQEQILAAPGKVLHLPTVLGGVVPIYIIRGKVAKWNDSAIAGLNPGVKLPGTDITVAHRSDGSGTTYIFVDYLSKVSPDFKQKVGIATSVNWPVGVGGKGNEGVAGLVKQTPGAIGYVELIYALQNKLDYGSVQNIGGEFVRCTIDSVTAAAAVAATQVPKDFRVSITSPPGKGVYPISSFTWLLLLESPGDRAKARVMVDFVKWALTEGQKYAKDLGYAPLPANVVQLELEALKRIKI